MVFLPLQRITLTFSGDSPVALLISSFESWLKMLSVSTSLCRLLSFIKHFMINADMELKDASESALDVVGS